MFGDHVTLTVGGETLKVRRMTVAEIRAARVRWQGGKELIDDEYDRIIREHVETADGKEIDPSSLSLPQMQRLQHLQRTATGKEFHDEVVGYTETKSYGQTAFGVV